MFKPSRDEGLSMSELLERDTVDLLDILQDLANEAHDGHYTIMSFTTDYKVMFDTPDIWTMDRDAVLACPARSTSLHDALVLAIILETNAQRVKEIQKKICDATDMFVATEKEK